MAIVLSFLGPDPVETAVTRVLGRLAAGEVEYDLYCLHRMVMVGIGNPNYLDRVVDGEAASGTFY